MIKQYPLKLTICFLSGETLANRLMEWIRVSCVGMPPPTGTDHHSEGMVCADAVVIPRAVSHHAGADPRVETTALNMIDCPSAEKTGASIISGMTGPDITICCELLPSASATKSLFFPVAASTETYTKRAESGDTLGQKAWSATFSSVPSG